MYPIIIPVKFKSNRLANKNAMLLPDLLSLYEKNDLLKYVIVTSKDEEVRSLIGNKVKFHKESSDVKNDTIAVLDCAEAYNLNYVYLTPCTQPFKDLEFFSKSEAIKNKYDFICSASMITDRSIFNIDLKDTDAVFKKYSYNKKGSMLKKYLNIDGSMYLINVSFLRKCATNTEDEINHLFWSGNIGAIQCKHGTIDIDEQCDLDIYTHIKNQFIR